MNGPVVHIVDNDDGVRHSLAFLLQCTGYTVCTHQSATAFLAAFPSPEPICVISDIWMPDINGLELQLLLAVEHPDVPVVLMTGCTDISLTKEALQAGAVDVIEKPFGDYAILSAISAALDRRGGAVRSIAAKNESDHSLRSLLDLQWHRWVAFWTQSRPASWRSF